MTRLLLAYDQSDAARWRTLLGGATRHGAAAILVGSRGRGAAASTVLGSVASGLVHAAALPVLVVPERRSVVEPATDRRDDDATA